jgi:hypothetical protein
MYAAEKRARAVSEVYRYPIYGGSRNNSYINIYDTFYLDENMIELLLCPALSFLLLAAMLVTLYNLDNVEDIKRKELQKLVSKYLD